MRQVLPEEVELGRVIVGRMRSSKGNKYGAFRFWCKQTGHILNVIFSSGGGWEHASVSRNHKQYPLDPLPSWEDMDYVKHLFWDDSETVVQYHPKESKKVNIAEVLHLWKKTDAEFILPPQWMV